MNRIFAALSLVCASFCFAPPSAWAVDIAIDTMPVGNPGNVADTTVMNDGTTGYGSVAYDYRIGTTEVTNAQYAAFLNAKARSDPLGLYHIQMSLEFGGITQSGVSPNFTYSTIASRDQMPVNFVSWYDSIRFANWLNNGQGSGDTETGAYTLSAATVTRNPGATWFLPSENEWYKAAYHKNDGVTGNYFQYPTSNDAVPTAEAPPGGSNSANYNFVVRDLTNVGAYTGTTSPYGAFDMGGNVWEWNEALIDGSFRGVRGGSFGLFSDDLLSSDRATTDPTYELIVIGFRVATVPEPSTAVLAILACGLGWALRKRFK